MGLDMYLNRKKYIGANYEHRNITGNIDIKRDGKNIPIDFNKVSYIEEAVGYWRKANAIHKWFVDNIQEGVDDCREYYVEKEKMKELLETCKEVKEKAIMKKGKVENGRKLVKGEWQPVLVEGEYVENEEEIREILPPQDGFFFGGTNIDQYYMQDIDDTIRMFEDIFKEEEALNEDGIYCDYYYSSSW